MSIYDKASLVLIPSGTKTSKVYSQKPVSGDGDFTFSRSTAATRVNADGNIEKETQNLLLQSNDFDTTWTTLNASVTGGQADKDGGTDAWLLQNTSSSGRVYQTLSASGVLTYSVYAKAGNVNWMALYVNASPYQYIFFDLANVAVGNDISGSSIDATITDEGSGWVRCSVSLNANGNTTDFRIFPASGNGGLASSGQNIYIQDAQLEQGLVARDYIETTSSAVEGGITDNVPRLDYTDSSCPALLLEPQRTNLLPNSEYISTADWIKTGGVTWTNNYDESPEGVDNACRVQFGATGTNQFFYDRAAATSSSANTFSFYVKGTSGETIDTYVDGTSSSDGYYFFQEAITLDGTWQRIEHTFTLPANAGTSNYVIRRSASHTATEILVYGFQVEAGASYATSYIPTYGTSVTRNVDNPAAKDLSDFLGDSYSIFFDFRDSTKGATTANFNYLYNSSQLVMYIYGSTLMLHDTSGENYTTFSFDDGKVCFVYDGTNAKYYRNGVLVKSVTASSRWENPDNYYLIRTSTKSKINYNNFLTFPTALTDQEAIDLTTL